MSEQSFIEYWNAIDEAMKKHFGIDTGDAGIDADLIASAQEECQTPEEFALWFGEKYDLTQRSEYGFRSLGEIIAPHVQRLQKQQNQGD